MSFAAVITVIVDMPEARNHVEAELYGKNYADKFREAAEDPLLDCRLEEVVDYEVDN